VKLLETDLSKLIVVSDMTYGKSKLLVKNDIGVAGIGAYANFCIICKILQIKQGSIEGKRGG
jgi:hypothetical protein